MGKKETHALSPEVETQLKASRAAAQLLRAASSKAKNAALAETARLLGSRRKEILRANSSDLTALKSEATAAFRDRLALSPARIDLMIESLNSVRDLPDPVGEEVDRRTLANGLLARRVRAPLGVILMIFESRPNVAVESWSLALKSGNAIILRGGKESRQTTAALYAVLSEALATAGLPRDSVWGITDPDRGLAEALLERDREIDIVVPRGGDALIEFVVQNARMPIIKNDRGLCHVYVHEDADLDMAARIVVNAKCQRPGVCNSIETLLVHRAVAPAFLPKVHELLSEHDVSWSVDEPVLDILRDKKGVKRAGALSFDTEYLDFKINAAVVDSLDAAITHIEAHGSRHSEAIITSQEKTAREFQARVDAAAVYWNASTRFTDGFELGLGGELGISTQKLHVRGPVGLRELTSARWIIDGTGQIRGE